MRLSLGLALGLVGWFCALPADGQEVIWPRLMFLGGEPKKDKDKPIPIPDVPRDEIRPTFNPPMIGDFPGTSSLRVYTVVTTFNTQLTIPQQRPNPEVPPPPPIILNGTTTVTDTYFVVNPSLVRGAFKITEGESPRPVDRVYVNYNFYSQIPRPVSAAASSLALSTSDPSGGSGFSFAQTTPDVLTQATFGRASVHRTVFGIEKTFLDEDASISLKLPIFQLNQSTTAGLGAGSSAAYLPSLSNISFGTGSVGAVSNATDSSGVGDLSIVLKYALINDRATGDVFSVGMVITVPTGPDIEGVPHSTLLQPWLGFIRNYDGFFLHGFSSVVVGTDDSEPTLLFNDLGIGWWLYQAPEGRLLRGIIPTIEGHLTTPLNHRDPNGRVSATDIFAFTGGLHFQLGNRTTFTLGLGTPVTGPRPYELEASALINVRY